MAKYSTTDLMVMAKARVEANSRLPEIFEEWAEENGLTAEQAAGVREELGDTIELWEYLETLDPTEAAIIEFLLYFAGVSDEAARKARLAARKVA